MLRSACSLAASRQKGSDLVVTGARSDPAFACHVLKCIPDMTSTGVTQGQHHPESVNAASVASQQVGDLGGDEADSHPQHSTGEVNPGVGLEGTAEHMPRPSASSFSVAAQDSSDVPQRPLETEVMSSPAATAQDSSRPTDDQIIAQENQIREEQAQRPFIGNVEPICALKQEYEEGSSVFLAKIATLEGQYSQIRRARGDGNCFFRSFMFAYMEHLLTQQDWRERDRVVEAIKGCRQQLLAICQDIVFEDPMAELCQQLQALSDPVLAASSLEAVAGNDMLSNTLVMFLRFLTSSELQAREDFFAPFVMGMSDDLLSVEAFRRRFVEPMGEESDHVHIVALTNAIQAPIRVVYLDRSMAGFGGGAGADSGEINHHDFVPETAAQTTSPAVPRVHLLYRPGHFDILLHPV